MEDQKSFEILPEDVMENNTALSSSTPYLIQEILDNVKTQANEFMIELFQKNKQEIVKQNEELKSQLEEIKFNSLSFSDRIAELERVEKETNVILEQKKNKLKELEEEKMKVAEQRMSALSTVKNGVLSQDVMDIKNTLLERIAEHQKEILNIQGHIDELCNDGMQEVNREFSVRIRDIEAQFDHEIQVKKSKYPKKYWDEYENYKTGNTLSTLKSSKRAVEDINDPEDSQVKKSKRVPKIPKSGMILSYKRHHMREIKNKKILIMDRKHRGKQAIFHCWTGPNVRVYLLNSKGIQDKHDTFVNVKSRIEILE